MLPHIRLDFEATLAPRVLHSGYLGVGFGIQARDLTCIRSYVYMPVLCAS